MKYQEFVILLHSAVTVSFSVLGVVYLSQTFSFWLVGLPLVLIWLVLGYESFKEVLSEEDF